VPEIVAAMVEAAKGGDTAAAKLILERTVPALRAEELPVTLEGIRSTSSRMRARRPDPTGEVTVPSLKSPTSPDIGLAPQLAPAQLRTVPSSSNKASATANAVQPLPSSTTALIRSASRLASLHMTMRRLELGDLGPGQKYFIHDLRAAH
jgi:hypothetical protein